MSPFDGDGLWLRCALHAHTTNSDGEMAPDMLVRHFEWSAYDVLAITDHWVRTVERSTRKLVVIASIELNARVGASGDDAHVLALGVEADPEPPDGDFEPLQTVVDWIRANGGLPYLAHTYWSGLRTEQWVDCDGLLGVEVWNSGCELEIGRGDSSIHWDEALELGKPLQGLATDDSHHPGYDSGFAWTMVRAPERSQEAVLAALRAGSFYGSTGPSISGLEIDGDFIEVRCSPAQSVTLVSSRHRGARANAGRLGYPNLSTILERDSAGLITAVRLEKPPLAPFGRVVVSDTSARRAWTNPLWTTA
ncbi:MAG TPA: CehA/McbA family metallohydrolase [Gaiellaceae bacterium]